jgi:hypothetical protein
MANPCKICNSDKKEQAEQMILQGYTNWHVAKTLTAMGLPISYASVNRHKIEHMKEYEEQIKEVATAKNGTVSYERIGVIDVIDILDKALKTKNNVHKFRKISEYVSKILINQVMIVIALQEKFMKGECKYPFEEMRGLAIVNDILIKFEVFISNLPESMPLTIINKTLNERANDISQAMIDGKINVDIANKLLNNLSTSAKIFEIDELVKRIETLEAKG